MTSCTELMYSYPNLMGRCLLSSIEEVVGRKDYLAILNAASLPELIESAPPKNLEKQFHFEKINRIQTALEQQYGTKCGQGLSLRIGRAFFNLTLRELGPQVGLSSLAFRLLPLKKKVKAGLESLAEIFNRYSDQYVSVSENGNLYWIVEQCPVCWGKRTVHKNCSLTIGFLQEAMYWITSGRQFHIEEQQCQALGDPTCTFSIDKKPIE
jgi:predicted hydrocarbon binding protein